MDDERTHLLPKRPCVDAETAVESAECAASSYSYSSLSSSSSSLPRRTPPALFFALVAAAASVVSLAVAAMLTVSPQEVFHMMAPLVGLGDFVSDDVYATSATASLSVRVASPVYGEPVVVAYLPWDTVAEPFKDQVLSLDWFTDAETGAVVPVDSSLDLSEYTVVWTVNGGRYTGETVVFRVDIPPQVLTCDVTVSRGGVEVASAEFTMAVKYVRREIRSLTEDDRNMFLQTLRLLYDVSTDDGRALYGDKYLSAETLLFRHLNGAGRTDCDHWHDGAGIVVQHLAFTLLAEQALQAVEPSLAMPYWEYAMDTSLYRDWYDSAVFQDDWFGAASPANADHAIERGLWAGVKLPDGAAYKTKWSVQKTGSLNPFVNGYGLMRSPWNNNPSPYIGRHNLTYGITTTKMPDCAVMSSCYASKSLSGMTDCLNGVTHGPVHILIGGNWGEGDVFQKNRDISFLQGMNKLLFFKNLWRAGFTRCPTSCDDTQVKCACAVPDEYITRYGAQGILERAGVWDQMAGSLQKGDVSDATVLAALRAAEDPASVGEMFSSAAPYDPAFWPVHGQIDRVLSLKRVRLAQGYLSSKTFSEEWGFAAKDKRYLAGRCDWTGVASVEDLTLPTCSFHVSNSSCFGHGENDLLDFDNFQGQGETYTNGGFYEFMHPWNDALPYTYDTFDFDYCADQGVDITTADTAMGNGKNAANAHTLMGAAGPHAPPPFIPVSGM